MEIGAIFLQGQYIGGQLRTQGKGYCGVLTDDQQKNTIWETKDDDA